MQFYSYSALDSYGKPINGMLQASSPEHASQILSERGYRVTSLARQGQSPSARSPMASPPVAQAAYRTKKGTDKENGFLFAQAASQIRAGINPAKCFTDLAQHTSHEGYRDSFLNIAKFAGEGGQINRILALYPDLYSPSLVGMVRAGEEGGFLPDALSAISDQAMSAHKFRRSFWWLWFVAINALVGIPLGWLMSRSMIASWEKIDANGGQGNPFQAIGSAYLEKIVWPIGPAFLFLVVLVFSLRAWLSSTHARMIRHRIGLAWPVFGARARQECLTTFSWVLSLVSKGGASPQRAWQLAADAVPNLEMRRRLLEAGSRMTESTRLSDVAFHSGLFPEEYAPMISTGELVGDVPGSLQRLAQASQVEFESAQNYARARAGCWGALGCFVTSGIILAMLIAMWYLELPAKVLKGLEP